ncbi:PDDEXK nuclease domain-containing protein [Solirubrobacter phytolaccae]|uniref:PDDEXK nuclease domain-containing protein n=1 Tax=Solirubrobacter phytolaccae TaxID=1404360 RepID=A0A9X3N6R2_9ACTN|nr:PDDEXK nuclease domain-containing protein [Solirubrobacter phytolaccae]MDA0179319.1 PDDEXK nuclease domain-containing protein [Solirubrobacter phytolaccae]
MAEIDFDDENGWWTCHPETRAGDLAVVYRSAGARDSEFPVRGPKDLAYVVLATSDAFRLDENPLAVDAGFGRHYGCHHAFVAKIDPPIRLAELRADLVLSAWPALKASFVRAAMPMPEQVWQRLLEIAGVVAGRRPSNAVTGHRPLKPVRTELELENWLAQNLSVLREHGLDLELIGQQVFCKGHDGTIDILCHLKDEPRHYVVIELKAGEVRRDAVGQILGYVGWVRNAPDAIDVTGVLIGQSQHRQVPYALAEVVSRVRWISWDSIEFPDSSGGRTT